jgi:hypothetical protein
MNVPCKKLLAFANILAEKNMITSKPSFYNQHYSICLSFISFVCPKKMNQKKDYPAMLCFLHASKVACSVKTHFTQAVQIAFTAAFPVLRPLDNREIMTLRAIISYQLRFRGKQKKNNFDQFY